MNGDAKFMMYFFMKPFYVFFIAVSGGMHKVFAGRAITNDLHSLASQPVFHPLYRSLIARHDGSGENNSVSFLERKFGVRTVGRAVESREFFSLSSGHEHHHFVRRGACHLLDRDYSAFFGFEESGFDGHFNIGFHRTAVYGYFLS